MIRARTIKLMCTVGPASMNEYVLRRMEHLGVELLRINMSHTSLKKLEEMVKMIRGITAIPICIDTEGAQIRSGELAGEGLNLRQGALVRLKPKRENMNDLVLTPKGVFEQLSPGTMLTLDFSKALVMVVEKRKDGTLIAMVLKEGRIGSNKAVNADSDIILPSITEKDRAAIKYAIENEIDTFALSFTNSKDAVEELRSLAGKDATIIAKVETQKGILNLSDIVNASDAILIDRGDLSREVPVERLPRLQKMIINEAHNRPIPVYVATNLLESMVLDPYPSRAEVNDIANTLMDGADGLVLAAETAIGRYPVQCVSLVRRMISQHLTDTKDVVTPKAGLNVSAPRRRSKGSPAASSLSVNQSVIRDMENIENGCYHPLSGFMRREEMESVLDSYSLPNGEIWTMPIILQVPDVGLKTGRGEAIEIRDAITGEIAGWVTVDEIYKIDKNNVALRWFGTNDNRHPGVRRFLEGGDCIVAGETRLAKRHFFVSPEFCLTPSQVRTILAYKGWERVVGFHTRNIPHRAHEHIQSLALERTGADALFIHPALGEKKPGDFTAEAILEGYKALIGSSHLKDRTLLSGFFANSWYAGPREAVFSAICRRNYGCSHFVIGRDHTGFETFYRPEDTRRLFEKLGDIGIEPVFFDTVMYDETSGTYREINHGNSTAKYRKISGTEVRHYFSRRQPPPEWMVKDEVAKALIRIMDEGKGVLVA